MSFLDYLRDTIHMNTLVVFGLFLLCGVAGGMVANRFKWMPTITAFMLLGLLTGPHGLGLITTEMMAESSVLIDIALGLIFYKLGNMLHPKAMLRSRKLQVSALLEGGITGLAVFAGGIALGLETVPAAMIAAISVSSSPAVLVHVAEEMRAKGPITERAKSLVALNNLVAFVLFSALLPFGLSQGDASFSMVIGLPLYRLAGAAAVGIAVAWLAIMIAQRLRPQDEHYRFAIVIGAVILTLGLSAALGMSALFSPLVLGIATRWFETSRFNLSRVHLGEGGDLFFIVLFVMAGAKINVAELIHLGWVPLALVLFRAAGKCSGIYLAGRINGAGAVESQALSLLLVPMAGMAIGLVATTNALAPALGATIATIIFAMVAVFETIGPFLAARAFLMSGEAEKREAPVEDDWQKEEETAL